MCTAHAPTSTIWTIGHSNHPLETLLALLAQHRIDVVVDVRSSPYSALHPNSTAKRAPSGLAGDRAVQYVFLGDLLGGRGEDTQFYDADGHVLYGRVAQSPGFRQGIEQLLALPGRSRARRSYPARRIPPIATDDCWWAGCWVNGACTWFTSVVTAVPRRGRSGRRRRSSARPRASEAFSTPRSRTSGNLHNRFPTKSAAEFFRALQRAGIRRLIDVRLNNTSQLAGFAKRDDLQYFLRELCRADISMNRLRATKEILDAYKKQRSRGKSTKSVISTCWWSRGGAVDRKRLFEVPAVLLCGESSPIAATVAWRPNIWRAIGGGEEIVHL